ncbi:MAG: zinc ribbon domain-containing protein [bacterium]
MPIYEYACNACGRKSSILVRLRNESQTLRCKHCGSDQLRRLLSGFALHKSESGRLRELDTQRRPDDSYYRDDRNIGLWAKKRMQELGVDLGDKLDEKIEKARTSKLDDLVPT